MSDLAATNCGCGDDRSGCGCNNSCGCNGGCGCGNRPFFFRKWFLQLIFLRSFFCAPAETTASDATTDAEAAIPAGSSLSSCFSAGGCGSSWRDANSICSVKEETEAAPLSLLSFKMESASIKKPCRAESRRVGKADVTEGSQPRRKILQAEFFFTSCVWKDLVPFLLQQLVFSLPLFLFSFALRIPGLSHRWYYLLPLSLFSFSHFPCSSLPYRICQTACQRHILI